MKGFLLGAGLIALAWGVTRMTTAPQATDKPKKKKKKIHVESPERIDRDSEIRKEIIESLQESSELVKSKIDTDPRPDWLK